MVFDKYDGVRSERLDSRSPNMVKTPNNKLISVLTEKDMLGMQSEKHQFTNNNSSLSPDIIIIKPPNNELEE